MYLKSAGLKFKSFGSCAGTLFRPLSLEVPQPLFPVAGYPVVQHHIEAARQVCTDCFYINFYCNIMGIIGHDVDACVFVDWPILFMHLLVCF
jgi:hypothetical protein